MKRVSAIVLSMTLAALPLTASADDAPQWKKTGNAKAVKLEQCVEDTEVMRKEHMTILMHQRDETMHKGIRTKDHSLVNCVDCHANKDEQGKFIPVDAKDQFCQTCHAFTGVGMDCFQCHATKPRDTVGNAYFHPLVTPNMKQAAHLPQLTGLEPTLDNSVIDDLLIGPSK